MTSIERFIGVYFPFKAKEICSFKITRRIIVGLVVVLLLFESQLLFIVDEVKGEDNSTFVDCGPASNSKFSFEIYKHMDSVLYSYLPITVMVTCNIGIIVKLISAKRGSKTVSNALSKGAKRITIMLVGISILFVVCTLPYAVMYQVHLDVSTNFYAVIILLMYTNHSVNIIIYAVTNIQFRRELTKMFSLSRNGQVYPQTDDSTVH